MSAIGQTREIGYREAMTSKSHSTRRRRADPRGKPSAVASVAERIRRNRIYELTKARGWTYADVAERATDILKPKKPIHEITITRLASGAMKLTQDWMETLGKVYSVTAAEIIAAPIAEGLRRVPVVMTFESGIWASDHRLPDDQQFEVMINDDSALREVPLYGGEIRGNDMNLRYPSGSIVILSYVTQRPGEIAEGKRYHVRVTRKDGTCEETIRRLIKDGSDRYWLMPESSEPAFRAVPLDGEPDMKVEIIGRVRFVVTRED